MQLTSNATRGPKSLHLSVDWKKLNITATKKGPLPILLEAQDHSVVSRASHPLSAIVLKSSGSDRDTGCDGRALQLHDIQARHRCCTSRRDDHARTGRGVAVEVVDADHLAGSVEGGALAGGCEDDIGLAVGVGDICKLLALEGGRNIQTSDVRGQAEGIGHGGTPDRDTGGRRGGSQDGCQKSLHDHFEGVLVLKVMDEEGW